MDKVCTSIKVRILVVDRLSDFGVWKRRGSFLIVRSILGGRWYLHIGMCWAETLSTEQKIITNQKNSYN